MRLTEQLRLIAVGQTIATDALDLWLDIEEGGAHRLTDRQLHAMRRLADAYLFCMKHEGPREFGNTAHRVMCILAPHVRRRLAADGAKGDSANLIARQARDAVARLIHDRDAVPRAGDRNASIAFHSAVLRAAARALMGLVRSLPHLPL